MCLHTYGQETTHHTRIAQANTQHTQRLPYKKIAQGFPWGASPYLMCFGVLCAAGAQSPAQPCLQTPAILLSGNTESKIF